MTNRDDGYMTTHCTAWSSYDVPTIWSTVSDEGDSVSYLQVAAWRETSETIDRHAAVLKSALDQLMETWPPERDAIAQQFFDMAQVVLLAMNEHSRIAATNSSSLHGIITALENAKVQIKKVYEDWNERQATKSQESTLNKALDKVTFWSDEDAWQVDLKKKATTIMINADEIVSENRRQMEASTAYSPPRDSSTPFVPDGAINTHSPSIAALSAPSPSTITDSISTGPQPKSAIVLASATLGSVQADARISGHNPNSPHHSPTNMSPAIGLYGVPLGPSHQRAGETLTGHIPVNNFDSPSSAPEASKITDSRGVIGAATEPMTPVGGGRFGSTNVAARRPTAPGGVIGETATRPDSRFARLKRQIEPKGHTFDPDNPWATSNGVPPVIEARNSGEHINGPGIIGIDR